MPLSPTGKTKLWAYGLIVVLDATVLALSVSVNIFQEFFFMADLFPLFLSIVTLAILLLQVVLDLTSQNAFTSRPAFEVPLLGTLTTLWLAFNSFSTSRWNGLPNCSVFSDDFPDERVWCRNMQGLRVIIWVEWAALLFTTLKMARVSVVHARRGSTAVWHTALSRLHSSKHSQDSAVPDTSSFYRGSSIFGFDKMNGHQKNPSMASRDWFAPAEPSIRVGDNAEGKPETDAGSYFGGVRAGQSSYGTGTQSTIPPQQQFQIPSPTRGPAISRTIDGFEIVSGGYYSQNESSWNQRS